MVLFSNGHYCDSASGIDSGSQQRYCFGALSPPCLAADVCCMHDRQVHRRLATVASVSLRVTQSRQAEMSHRRHFIGKLGPVSSSAIYRPRPRTRSRVEPSTRIDNCIRKPEDESMGMQESAVA